MLCLCSLSPASGKKKKHDCRENHKGSSKSAEPDVAVNVSNVQLRMELSIKSTLVMMMPQHRLILRVKIPYTIQYNTYLIDRSP